VASTGTEAEKTPAGMNSAAQQDDAPEVSPCGACWDEVGGDDAANEAIEVEEVVEEEEALLQALYYKPPR
jgi:hypothetical protein